MLRNRSAQSLFGKKGAILKNTANSNSNNNWRAGIAAGSFNCICYEINYISLPLAGVSILRQLMFSLPNPFGETVSLPRLP
jgi:hypothetical protein